MIELKLRITERPNETTINKDLTQKGTCKIQK